MYDTMIEYGTETDFDEYDIDTQFQALESEYFMLSLSMEDFGAPYGLALEDSSSSVYGAKFKNFMIKAQTFIKRIFAAIPKMFAKLIQKIKHSKLVTKARLQAGLPKDLKHIAKDKASVIKKLRMDILTTKQKLLEYGDKKIEKTVYLSEELNNEINSILRIAQVSTKARKEVIAGKFDVSEQKIQKLLKTYDELQGMDTSRLHDELQNKIAQLKHACDNERLFALCVPIYNGNDKSNEYRSTIERNCKNGEEITGILDNLIRNNTTFAEGFNDTVAKGLRGIENIGQGKRMSMNDDGSVNPPSQSISGSKFRLSNIPQKAADASRLDRGAKVLTSGILKITSLYTQGSKQFLKYSQEYCNICADIYRIYDVPESSNSDTDVERPNNPSGEKALFYNGTISWNDEKGCWQYSRICIAADGKNKRFTISMEDEKDKSIKPKPDKSMVKELNLKIKNSSDFKKFVENEEANTNED